MAVFGFLGHVGYATRQDGGDEDINYMANLGVRLLCISFHSDQMLERFEIRAF